MTAALALYQNLALTPPWRPATTTTPLIIYGASSAVGSFAVQFAQQSNIHPLICVAGKGVSHVETLIDKSKGDEVLDYRVGPAELVIALRAVIEKSGTQCLHAFDTISENGTYETVSKAFDGSGGAKIALIIPAKDYSAIPESVQREVTFVGSVHGNEALGPKKEKRTGTKVGDEAFGELFFKLIGRGLEEGWFKGHPYEVVPGGLGGVEKGLTDLKAGKASAVKYVFRVGETEGVQR